MTYIQKNYGAAKRAWLTMTRDHTTGEFSLNHLVTILAVVILSVAFIKNATKFNLTWDDYIGYAVSMAVSASPALMAKLLGLKYGTPPTPPAPKEG